MGLRSRRVKRIWPVNLALHINDSCTLYDSRCFVIEYLAPMQSTMHTYEVRPRKDKRGVDLISDALPSGRLWQGEPDAIGNAVGYAPLTSCGDSRLR